MYTIMVKRDLSPRKGIDRAPQRRGLVEVGAAVTAAAALLSACSPAGGEAGPSAPQTTSTAEQNSGDTAKARAEAAKKYGIDIQRFDGDPVQVIAKELGVENKPDLVSLIAATRPDKLDEVKGTEELTKIFRIPVAAIRKGHEAEDICQRLSVLTTAAGNALNDPALIKASRINNMTGDELVAFSKINYTDLIQIGLTGQVGKANSIPTAPVAWRAVMVKTANESTEKLPGGDMPYYYIETYVPNSAPIKKTADGGFVLSGVTESSIDTYLALYASGRSSEELRAPLNNKYTIILTVKKVGEHYIVAGERTAQITQSHAPGDALER